ncbi:thiamine transporter 2-like isoform X3 [Phoenix dactylifera]|uniref:Thiamine transporter 2-like isoform X3 n=1 Tax=Phoenix dactylifera TaxID=42345 RepID=A0A8B9AM93_PHODC|nr:thiamine transporter 2-like isoform X3 [Phoenix dactylifera]
MEEWRRWLTSLIPGSSSIPRSTLAVLLVYSFSSQFLPIEPYFVPYITSVKKFSNHQVTVDIFPISVYSQLIFTLLMAPVCLYLSHKITYGFGVSARLVFSSYIFLLVSEEEYQTMTSLTTTTSLLSFMLASELGQLLAFQEASYGIFFVISLIALGICCAVTFLLPKDHSLSSISSLTSSWGQSKQGWTTLLKETWHGRRLQIFSLWWAVAFAGISLVQNYGTNLFDAVDSKSKLNGHILAASEAAASLGSYCAIYIEKFASKSCLSIYILGSALMGILCVSMGISSKIWVTYCLYITICGIYQTLACLVSVRCGQLLSNGQYILLFSINSFAGLLIETLLQAAIEISGLSIFSQFISFAGFFFLATAICVGLHFVDSSRTSYLVLETEPEHHISDST